jgi:hypothetical protein
MQQLKTGFDKGMNVMEVTKLLQLQAPGSYTTGIWV